MRIKELLKNPYKIFNFLAAKGLFNWLPDKPYLKLRFRASMGKKLNLKNPQTFNEKLQWLKLNDRKPEYTMMVDKYESKKYVANIIGEEYIIPTLGVWDKFDDIDFDKLPDKFVLKCTHDSGGLVICKDKSNFDKRAAKLKIEKSLNHDYFKWGREWPYKNVRPRIIAEQYMEDSALHELRDYKFFCFGGEPKLTLVCTDRFSKRGLKEDFYDLTWERMAMKRPNHDNADIKTPRPKYYNLMRDLSKKLSDNIPFLRCDFYEIDNKVYFGELTFFPATGMEGFYPDEWDKTLGGWIDLGLVK